MIFGRMLKLLGHLSERLECHEVLLGQLSGLPD